MANDLDVIRALYESLPPGPWRWTRTYGIGNRLYWCLESDASAAEGKTISSVLILQTALASFFGTPVPDVPEVAFVAQSWQAVGALFAEVERLREENTEYTHLFALQSGRMAEAITIWRAEKPDERELISPDLGALLAWLLSRGDRASVAADVANLAAEVHRLEGELFRVERERDEARAVLAERAAHYGDVAVRYVRGGTGVLARETAANLAREAAHYALAILGREKPTDVE